MFLRPIRKIKRRTAQVAYYIGQGLNYDEIARELGLSVSTVRHSAERFADQLDGELTDEERKKGPRYLILCWVKQTEGRYHAIQTVDGLITESAKKDVESMLALDVLARRSRPGTG